MCGRRRNGASSNGSSKPRALPTLRSRRRPYWPQAPAALRKQSEAINAAAPALLCQAFAREMEAQLELFTGSEFAFIREQGFQPRG
jgi:hypothetical protein